MRALANMVFTRILGWHFSGSFPDVDKCVVIVVPHTSWVDFVIGLLVRKIIGREIHFIAKDSLFRPPFGWYFRWMGGSPIDRSRSHDTVAAIAAIFREKDIFRLALSPEGTRKKVREWKTGFYYIARAAQVPIILVAFDFGKKEVKISRPQIPSGDKAADFQRYKAFYKGVVGKVPEYSF